MPQPIDLYSNQKRLPFWRFLPTLSFSLTPLKPINKNPLQITHKHTVTQSEMDEEGIGLVLARASELRSKITNCIHNASTLQTDGTKEERESEDKDSPAARSRVAGGEPGEEEEEAESLLNIRDALESLETQLSSLQALQQQQWYEKEASLAEIDYSRKKLLKKLKEYKGEDLEVIREATAFASETVEENNDLLLPPYPSHPSRSTASDNGYLSHFPSKHKLSQNGVTNNHPSSNELKESVHGSESKSLLKGVGQFISAATKTVLTLVGVITVLNLAGFEPRLGRKSDFKVLDMLQQQQGVEEERAMIHCPPGKVLVVENGETRCLVKERVEIPFESVVMTPDVNYGCG